MHYSIVDGYRDVRRQSTFWKVHTQVSMRYLEPCNRSGYNAHKLSWSLQLEQVLCGVNKAETETGSTHFSILQLGLNVRLYSSHNIALEVLP